MIINKRFLFISFLFCMLSINAFAGNFYVNAVVIGPNDDEVIKFLKKGNTNAYLSRPSDIMTVVFEEKIDSQDPNKIDKFCSSLSKSLNCTVFSVLNHDDSILAYVIYKKGELLDRYDSYPGYFGDGNSTPGGGDVKLLSKIFYVEKKAEELKEILHPTPANRAKYVMAISRHVDLAKVLNLPEVSVGFGYKYVKEFLESSPSQEEKRKYGFEHISAF